MTWNTGDLEFGTTYTVEPQLIGRTITDAW
jgi:hypothetical protein